GYDSPSAVCRQNPAYCAKVAGEEAILPGTGSLQTVATAGATVAVAVKVLDEALHLSIKEALKKCANQARTNVLLKHMSGRRPTPQECNENVEWEGRTLTRAMWLGNLMHDDAFDCIQERLELLRPGGFSLKQRYRYNQRTRETTLISKEEVKRLIEQGRKSELRGTIEPDVVLHPGNPLEVDNAYDFKFPCSELDRLDNWREYPAGHPHQGLTQKVVYEKILKATAWQVIPHMGIYP
ncbi:MAG TPA: hypothetical protein VLQ93_19870, partial [Myxococcaceae bacterium]|nr:hypothetical protein [Myxococcaceae bacterium]